MGSSTTGSHPGGGIPRPPGNARPRNLRVAVLTTGRAPGLAGLLAHPARDREWTLQVVLATDPAAEALSLAATAGVSTRIHPLEAFARERGVAAADLAVRPAFDRRTRAMLEPFEPGLLVLCGYLHVVTAPLLEAFPDRIVNLHDSDLLVKGADGLPRYRGLRSTRDAVLAGEAETRSTVHLVDPRVDTGPALIRSWAFPTHPMVREARQWGAADILKAYAYAQREWMMRACWTPLLAETLAHFARDHVRRVGGRVVVDGRRAPLELEPPATTQGPAGAAIPMQAAAGSSTPAAAPDTPSAPNRASTGPFTLVRPGVRALRRR